MSQSQDMAAIANLFSRTTPRNQTAANLKNSFQGWYDNLGLVERNFSDSVLVEARNRRDNFNRANATAGVAPTGATAPALLAVAVIPPGTYPDIRLATRKTNDKNAVKLVQRFLKANPIDGDFGPQTDKLVRAYQSTHKDTAGKQLKSDGWVGKTSWGAMIRDSAAVMNTPTNVSIAAAQASTSVNRPPTPPPTVAASAKTASAKAAAKPAPAPAKPKPKVITPPASTVQVAAKKAAAKVAAGKPINSPDAAPMIAAHLASAKAQLTTAANDLRSAPTWAKIGMGGLAALAVVFGVKAAAKAA